ncbi:hypothetical protein [Phenylobacterium sp.]|jgi:hypothetical protein|uniref:hypothetical protein n=1 Tax=Phenylobacterium sp. TaxID=1871053 RepID=UPI002F426401
MLFALGVAVAFLTQAAPDAAQPPAAALPPVPAASPAGKTVSPLVVTPQAKPTVKVEQNTYVCHREKVLGSMFPKKVCATKAQISERRAEDQEQVREWVRVRPLAQ